MDEFNSRLLSILHGVRRQSEERKRIAVDLPDNLASKHPSLYSELKQDGALIPAGTRIRWNGVVKKAAVDLWDTAQNTPDAAPTLWEDLNYYQGYRIIPEVITATLAFNKDEVGYWPPSDKFYRAVRPGVVYNPSVYPADWEEVTV